MTDLEQFFALMILDYLSDLFTVSSKEQFTQAEILVILNLVKHDRELFDPLVVAAQEIATGDQP